MRIEAKEAFGGFDEEKERESEQEAKLVRPISKRRAKTTHHSVIKVVGVDGLNHINHSTNFERERRDG